MPIRITGMNSGLDTESIISELVKAKSAKKDDLVKAQTKLQWKQDAWKELNSKVYSFYSKSLSNMRFQSDYMKKTTKVSNSNAASVITGANAVNGVQTLSIDNLAKTGYLTGAEVKPYQNSNNEDVKLSGSTKLSELGIASDSKIKLNGEEITLDAEMTVDGLVSKLKEKGVNASFDAKNQRFFISAKESGEDGDFTIEGGNADGIAALNRLGITGDGAIHNKGENARITLNGAVFVSNTNVFEINGLTITANAEATEFTISTMDDTDGIYDMIKGFLKEYNELINEMDKLYGAESAKGYEPLTDEEKESMSEKEIEKWEEKIKDSILRKDSTLSSVASAVKGIMSQGIKLGDDTLYLSDFGISTLGYFTAADNEKNAYHIDGDPDDSNTSGNGDKLKTAIANEPEKVVNFFTALADKLYTKLGDMMKKTEYSSSFTLYDDISMKEEYDDYKSKITKQEQKITDFEDRYYKKFSAMETALAKMSSKESAISGLLGM